MAALSLAAAAPDTTVPWERGRNLDNQPCSPGPQAKEVVTWQVEQKYFLDPTFGGALVTGQRNVFTTTEELTGIAFATQPRHLSPLVSRLRAATSSHTDTEWDIDYDFQLGRVNENTILANYNLGAFTFGGGDAFLQIPQPNTTPLRYQQFRVALGYGGLVRRGVGAATSFGIDAETGQFLLPTAQTTHNWDCGW